MPLTECSTCTQTDAAHLQVKPDFERSAAGALTNFADCAVQVALMSRIGLFFLKRIEVARHPRKPAQ